MTIAGCAFIQKVGWDVVVNDQAALCNAGGSVPGRYTEHSANDSIIM